MNENEILGFDPSQLSVFSTDETPKSTGNSLIYHTRPAESKSEDHVYRATIKVIYNPFDLKHSVLEQQSYSMQDANGYFSVVSSLTNADTSCPIFKAWKKCHYSEAGSNLELQARTKDKGGNGLFDKRFARYVTIQIIEDNNQPELVGKYMFWKLPKAVWDIINSKMNPSKESGKAPIPVMDFLFGRSIDIEVTPGPGNPGEERYNRETKYMAELSEDVVSCTYPDSSPLLNTNEQQVLDTYVDSMTKVWKTKRPEDREPLLAEINSDENTAELKKIYSRILEEIKGFCPNINEILGYKEWTPEVTTRVNNWINIVLEGNNPANSGNVPETIKSTVTESPATSEAEVQVNDNNSEPSSDLPF